MCPYKSTIIWGHLRSSAIWEQEATMSSDFSPRPCLPHPSPRNHSQCRGWNEPPLQTPETPSCKSRFVHTLVTCSLPGTSETPLRTELGLQKRPALYTLTQTLARLTASKSSKPCPNPGAPSLARQPWEESPWCIPHLPRSGSTTCTSKGCDNSNGPLRPVSPALNGLPSSSQASGTRILAFWLIRQISVAMQWFL